MGAMHAADRSRISVRGDQSQSQCEREISADIIVMIDECRISRAFPTAVRKLIIDDTYGERRSAYWHCMYVTY